MIIKKLNYDFPIKFRVAKKIFLKSYEKVSQLPLLWIDSMNFSNKINRKFCNLE